MKKDKPINLRMNSEVKEALEHQGFSMQRIFDWAINKLIRVEKESFTVLEDPTEQEVEK